MNEAVTRMPLPVEPRHAAPGLRLAEARQAQNLTPADVARQMKLSVWQVEALEAGRYDQLPGPIFVRGFIRNYARLVKLDADELLRQGGDRLPQPVERRETPPSRDIPFPTGRRPRWALYAGAAGAVVAALAIYEFYWNEPQTAGIAPVSARVPAASEPRKKAAIPAPAPAAGAAGTTVAVTERAEAERSPRPGERVVRLDFDRESWVEIRDRNERVIFSQLNRPGTHQIVQGLPPFSIVVGNAHGVRLTYDGAPVDLALHTKVDVARLILQ
jgi:cytoskeleton protein RodZ